MPRAVRWIRQDFLLQPLNMLQIKPCRPRSEKQPQKLSEELADERLEELVVIAIFVHAILGNNGFTFPSTSSAVTRRSSGCAFNSAASAYFTSSHGVGKLKLV